MTAPGNGGGGSYNANVVLTADSSQYQQQMQQNVQSTNRFSDALTTLTTKLDGITARAGKKLIQFSAADFAGLAGATALAANFEQQLSTLRATSVVTGRSFSQLAGSIEDTFTKFPVARSDVIQLTEAITNLGVTGPKQIGQLTQTFIKLGAATGESTTDLAQGLIQLSRMMGTTNAQQVGNYANALLTVSKNAGVSATSVLNFSQAIAPLARAAGISESSILGISTAFSKAGADGYYAANTFNQLISDITNMAQTGSPELAKYANLIGVTVGQFKKMDKTTALTDIFEAINNQGPRAIQTLNQLGIDGIRAQAAIAAVVQSGDLRQQIARATGSSHGQGTLNAASTAAFSSLSDQLEKTRNNFTQLGTEIGSAFLGPLEHVISVFNTMFNVMNKVIQPFAPLIAGVGALAGTFTGLAGAVLLAFGAITKLSLGALLLRPLAALRGGYMVGRDPTAVNNASTAYANNKLGVVSTGAYRVGAGLGSLRGPVEEGVPNAFSQAGLFAIRAPFMGLRWGVNASAATMADAAAGPPVGNPGGLWARMRSRASDVYNNAMTAAGYPMAGTKAAEEELSKTSNLFSRAGAAMTKAMEANKAAIIAGGSAIGVMGNEAKATAGAFVAAGRQAASAAASFAGAGLKAAGSGLMGLGGRIMSSPFAWLGLSFALPSIISAFGGAGNQSPVTYKMGPNAASAYDRALGQSATNLANFSEAVSNATNSLQGLAHKPAVAAQQISQSVIQASGSGYVPHDKNYAAFTGPGGVAAGAAYIQTIASQRGGLDARAMTLIEQDMVSQLGVPQAQRIINAFFGLGGHPASGAPGNINYSAIGSLLNNTTDPTLFGNVISEAARGAYSQFQVRRNANNNLARLATGINLVRTTAAGWTGSAIDNPRMQALNTAVYNLTGASPGIDFYAPGSGNLSGQSLVNFALGEMVSRRGNRGIGVSEQTKQFLQRLGINPQKIQDFIVGHNIGISTAVGNQVRGLPTQAEAIQLGNYLNSLLPQGWQSTRFQGPFASGNPEYDALMKSQLGSFAAQSSLIQSVSGVNKQIANPVAQAQAMQSLMHQATLQSGAANAGQALQQLADTATRQADPALAQLAETASQQKIQNYQATVVPTMTRSQQTAYYYSQLQQAHQEYMSTGTDAAHQVYQQALGNWQQQYQSNLSYMQQMYSAVKSFDTQRTREIQDYHTQVYRQTQAFHIQMLHAQRDYNIQVARTERNFNIQMAHSQRDFNTQRFRMQQDFNIQMERQALQSAQNIYNPYQRVYTQQTTDAGTLLQNLRDQNQLIKGQFQNLRELRQAGVTQSAIDVLQLADPTNAQELQQLVDQVTNDPHMVKAINAAIHQRRQATTQLTQSDYNVQFRQSVQDFHKEFDRMTHDFQVQRDDAIQSEKLALSDMAGDFTRSRKDAMQQESIELNQMNDDFHKMLKRGAQDMRTAMTEVTGDMEQLYTKTFKLLGKYFDTQAPRWAKVVQRALNSIIVPNQLAPGPGSVSSGGSGGPSSPGVGTGHGAAGNTAGNPIYTAGTFGVNPQGVYGHYGPGGKFYKFHGDPGNPAVHNKEAHAPHIANPKNKPRHDDYWHASPAKAQQYAQQNMGKHGLGNDWGWASWSGNTLLGEGLKYLWTRESNFSWSAANPSGAYGIPQSLPASKMASAGSDYMDNAATQIDWGLDYIKGRYHTIAKAVDHEKTQGWYDRGGVLYPGITRAINATGHPELVLTPQQLKVIYTMGKGTPTTNTYKIYNDNSTSFSGITVQASDPNLMAKQLQAKARLMKLATPAQMVHN